MGWLRDRAWQQAIAILLTVAGAALVYSGAADTGELDGRALVGVACFVIGLAAPLISQARITASENSTRSEDV